jgi:uncharacterized membrane protein YeaQ/YmgE (transglycosylase-associated protein family)
MINARYRKLTAALITVWFIFSLTASALHVFRTDPSRPPLPMGLTVLAPIAIYLIWFAASERFRQFALALSPRTLTLVQAWRIGGYVFLVLYTYGILPGMFALPAGWGDIAIGATAPFVAMKLVNSDHRKGFILWQVLGILDLVMAVTLGTTARLISPQGIATSAMTELPLSLIPTFAVPLLLILHLICIAQARRWREQQYSRVGDQLSSSAA